MKYFLSVDEEKDYRFYDTVDVEEPNDLNTTDIPFFDLTQSQRKLSNDLKKDLSKQLFRKMGPKKKHHARSYIYYLQNLMQQAENAILKAETMIPTLEES